MKKFTLLSCFSGKGNIEVTQTKGGNDPTVPKKSESAKLKGLMKNFMILFFSTFTFFTAYGQGTPTMAAPDPICDPADVISMFSNVYTDVTVDTWLTPWSAAPVTLTDLQIAGNDTKWYQDVTFLGIETVGPNLIDASGMTYFNISFWSNNATQFRVKLVDFGADMAFGGGDDTEHEITFDNPTQSAWVCYTIPLADFTNLLNTDHIAQLILSAMPNTVADFYIDNVYFSNSNCIVSAPDPTCDPANVISMFSNVYNDVAVDTWLTPWSAAPVTLTDLDICGNDLKLYEDVTFLGIETVGPNLIDASAMTNFNIDFWSGNATQFRVKLVDFGADMAFGGGDDTEHELTFDNPPLNQWVSYELPLASFTNLLNTDHIAQLILSAMPNTVADFYIDNVYFSTCSAPVDIEFCVDLNCFNQAPQVPSVAGTFTTPPFNFGQYFLADPDMDGIWCATVSLAPGTYEYRFFDQIEGQEALNPADPCVTAGSNRSLTVVAGMPQNLVFGWESCDPTCIPPPPGPDLPITFEDPAIDYALVDFAGTISTIAPDPTNAANTVVCTNKTAGSATFAGTVVANNGLDNPIPFTVTETLMTVRVWSPAAGTPVLLKVENSAGGPTAEVLATTSVAMQWETLVFNFSYDPAFNVNNTYNKIVIFFNFGNVPAVDEQYYWDDVMMFVLTNDLCADAIPIVCGSVTAGTTTPATPDGAPFCGTSNTAPGVWYSFVGTGGLATVNTCSPNTNYDTKLTVYEGGCGVLTCVAGNDDDFTNCTNFQSFVEFCTTPGTTYLVLVHGFSQGTGNFDLTLTCGEPLAVVCPPASLGTITCNDPIPPAATTVAGFIALGGQITDGCPPVIVTSTDDLQPPGDICGGQTLTRTYTIEDASSSFTCVQTLTISPPNPPTIVCPADMTVQCEADIMVDAANATVTTDCNLGFVTWVDQPHITGARDCDGTTYEYLYHALDDCGNMATCIQTWTLSNAAPTISVPAGTTVECAADIVTDPGDATVTTSCGEVLDVTIYAPVLSGTADCSGTTYTYTYRVEDQCEREATADRVFTIQNVGPTIDAPANTTCECLGGITPNGANATVDVSCDLGYDVAVTGPVASGPQDCPGTTYTYTYTATDDCGRPASDNQTFTINNGPPVFLNAPTIPLQLNCEDQGWEYIIQAWLASVKATNSCGLPLTVLNNYNPNSQGVCINNGTTVVTWRATDNCGRQTVAQSMIIINDTEPPVFTTPAQDELDICNYNTPAEFAAWVAAHGNAVAVDGCDQNITNNQWSTIPNNPQFPNCMNAMGSTSMTVTFVVRDDCGNKTSSTATFTALMTGGDFVESGDGEVEAAQEPGFELYQNQPNPFKEATMIGFNLPEAGIVDFKIYDVSGRLVYTQKGEFVQGYNQIDLNQSDLPSGILYYHVITATDSGTKKMVLLNRN